MFAFINNMTAITEPCSCCNTEPAEPRVINNECVSLRVAENWGGMGDSTAVPEETHWLAPSSLFPLIMGKIPDRQFSL